MKRLYHFFCPVDWFVVPNLAHAFVLFAFGLAIIVMTIVGCHWFLHYYNPLATRIKK